MSSGRTDQTTKLATSDAGDSVGAKRAQSVAVPSRGATVSHRPQQHQQQQRRPSDTGRTLAPISSVAKKSTVYHWLGWLRFPYELVKMLSVCMALADPGNWNGGRTSPPLSFLTLPSFLSLLPSPFTPLPLLLEVGPLNLARGLGERCKLAQYRV